jgi:hypothetical protein
MKYSRKFRRNSRNFRRNYRGGVGEDEPATTDGESVTDKAKNALSSVTGMFSSNSEKSETPSDSPGMLDSAKEGVTGALSSVTNIFSGSDKSEEKSEETPAQGGRRSRRNRRRRSRKSRRGRR